jgi:hypothetical protein
MCSICTNNLKLVRVGVLTVVSEDCCFQGCNIMWFVDGYQHFRGICLQDTKNEDIFISSMFLQNFGSHYLTSHPRKPWSSTVSFSHRLWHVILCKSRVFLCLTNEVCYLYLNIRSELSQMFECWSWSTCYCAWSSVSWWYVRSHLIKCKKGRI